MAYDAKQDADLVRLPADHLFELDADLRAVATELEGHPDNVAAAVEAAGSACADA